MLEKSIEVGKQLKYQRMLLGTLPIMQSSIGLYRKIKFYEINFYQFHLIKRTKYFKIKLGA